MLPSPGRAFNQFKWRFNDTLPDDGPGGVLINEIHSFGQIFTGCFYDLIRGIFNAGSAKGEAALWQAAKYAGMLLIAGAARAPHVPRFIQSVGRTMALEEEELFGGRYRSIIRGAFAAHEVPLGGSAMLAPRAAIGAALALKIRAQTVSLSSPSMALLKRHVHADPGARLEMRPLNIGGRKLAEAKHYRNVNLTGMAEYLRGVVASGAEPVLLECFAGRAAILGAVPDLASTEDEVRKFVAMLVRHRQISRPGTRSSGAGPSVILGTGKTPTHEIVHVRKTKVLRRIRFACRCGPTCGSLWSKPGYTAEKRLRTSTLVPSGLTSIRCVVPFGNCRDLPE